MNFVDSNGELGKYFLDPARKIPKAHMKSVCLMDRGEKSCRYASLLAFGFVCMKKSPLKIMLDHLVQQNKMVRKGDNCEGLGDIVKDNE